ncbi:la-related protein 4-like, partial [Carcharodon carcharias]|uniref:la-related protein 4-like n=1 Tax=Carcharodon carcharias TaxID=13397 RepID=UPI001B7E58B5
MGFEPVGPLEYSSSEINPAPPSPLDTWRPPPSEVPAVKLDLAPSNFPPLPGAVLSSQGESVLESRMSDVVRGVSKDKEMSKDAGTSPPVPAAVDVPHDPPPPPISTEPCVNLTLSPEPAAPTVSSPQPPDQSPTELTIQRDSHPRSAASSPLAATKPDRNTVTPLSEPRKLSYAEVCQRPPAAHPAREPRLGAAKGEEVAGAGGAGGGGGTGERQADRPQERPEGRTKECPAPRGGPPSPGGVRSGSGKANEQPPQQQQQQPQPAPQQQQQQQQQQQRRPFTHRSLPQGPARRSAKEQNVLLRSPNSVVRWCPRLLQILFLMSMSLVLWNIG